MVIRLMQLADFPPLQALWQAEHMVADREALRRVLMRNPHTCFVCELDGAVIGGALGLYDGRRGILQSVAIAPTHRNSGYGTALIQTVIAALKKEGATRIRLFVYRHNTDATRLYEKLGFSIFEDVHYMGFNTD